MSDPRRASRFLEVVLLVNFVVHGVAMLTMALFLTRGVPGGGTAELADRAAFVAENPWLWRLGWLPWHLCALVDVVMGVALVCTPWVPRLPAVLTLLVTLCAATPEQIGEFSWVTQGVSLAQAGDLEAYARVEARSMYLTVNVGASLYVVMALGWTWCFAAGGAWSRALTWLSVATWGTLAIGSIGLWLPEAIRPDELLVGVSTGLGFALMEVWFVLVYLAVRRRGD